MLWEHLWGSPAWSSHGTPAHISAHSPGSASHWQRAGISQTIENVNGDEMHSHNSPCFAEEVCWVQAEDAARLLSVD